MDSPYASPGRSIEKLSATIREGYLSNFLNAQAIPRHERVSSLGFMATELRISADVLVVALPS
jgi:hypothetical protein